ncbi:FmdB family zinc ribbon protein [Marinitoga sp. 38H-ov]|uniref:FmdB family zinc ribbon protein n=1 Tax=Marinitoga sp. 38H-ov TaxID=1755814 RepID=UPI0013EB1AD1|nr:FmdB family zinc ribbon protein [Marinitoga sp. 38H-ov]KAF2955632.1 FmdB family transcriptional regulator [Marinitoga sp. 38H-ov]
MPIYRYTCENCNHEFTVMHGMNEEPEILCEKCGEKAKRSIGKIGISFKGSGYYITDSKSSDNKK